MPETLLRTKLFVPPLRGDHVPRQHLLDRLSQNLQPNLKLTLVSAPAGYGKTTLLSQWVNRLDTRAAWLSLDEADDDLQRFWTYVIAACQTVVEGIGEAAAALLDRSQPIPGDTIPTLLINELLRQEQALILILDDYHVIENPSIHESVALLLDYQPDNLHLVLATRVDPPLPLARFRARHQLIEIRARDLRFDNGEAAAFLKGTMSLDLSAENVNALEGRTEGWIAGLQLAAIALQSAPQADSTAAFVRDFTGSHLFVAEYLVEEILRRQPENVQSFLLQTAVLERLNASLCEAVTQHHNAQAMLAALQRENLFLIALDSTGHWFRYHHLFADLLQARLPQTLSDETIAALHKRAANWYQENGLMHEAIKHALAAQDFEHMASLLENEARPLMSAGQARTLSKWLDALPPSALAAHPRLQIYRMWIDMMQEKGDLSIPALREKEQMLRAMPDSVENERLQVELIAVLCRFVAFAGDTDGAIRLGEEALARLPESETALRARAHSALAVAHWLTGDAVQAEQAHERCIALAQFSGNYSLAAHAMMIKGIIQTNYGRLHEAAQTYQAIVDMGGKTEQTIFFPSGQGTIGLASIHLEWNELETAGDYLEQGIRLCQQGGLAGLSTAHTIKARLFQAQGAYEDAAAQLRLLGETGVDPDGIARQILLSLAVGKPDEAARCAAPWLNKPAPDPTAPKPPTLIAEKVRTTLANLFLARGELETARQLLEQAQATAEPGGRIARLIEINLLQSLICQQEHHGAVTPAALSFFQQALELAEPEGYALLFLEQPADVTPLLQAAASQQEAPMLQRYARRLLDASRTYGRPTPAPARGEAAELVEMLTPREMEVLQLVALGDSNRTIAGKLVITVRTVKKHITNILGKLGASNRTQAVARARELGLLTSD